MLRVFALLGFVELTTDLQTGQITETTNLTILNFFLVRLGPMKEDILVRVLMCSQVSRGGLDKGRGGCSVLALMGSALGCW